jgi:phosphoribosylformimino-5-aminoimidazole carboxamide ribotide isomerase
MNVFPAVDILHGRCVQLVQGDRSRSTDYGTPLTCAERWLNEGATALHIVNLDGAFGTSKENAGQIREVIVQTGVEIQLGGGIRSLKDACSWLDLGVERVILSTYAVSHPEALSVLSDEYGTARIMAGVDARAGEIVVDGWERSAGDFLSWAELFVENGAGSLLYTNVNVEGLCNGIQTEPVHSLLDRVSVPVVVAGGITGISDVTTLRNLGSWGIVLGSALYNGTIGLKEALGAAV